jgi:hypothetical protein
VALWTGFSIDQRSAGHELAARSLAAFSPEGDADEKQAAAEAQVQLQLFEADGYARRAFLQAALQDPTDARRLNRREQAFSISLSQVKSAEARALFQDVILPAIHNSADPMALREAFQLMDRWSIAGTLSASESDSLASQLVEKMLTTEDTDAIDALGNGVVSLANQVSPNATDDLAWKLAIRSVEEIKPTVSDARLPALLALERALGTESAGKLAVRLIERMFTGKDGAARRTLAMEAKDPDAKVSQAVAGDIADKVVDRMSAEGNATSMEAWGAVLDSLKDVIDPAKAGELAARLAPRILIELGLAGSEGLFPGWRGLAQKATLEQSEKLVTLFTGALRFPFLDTHALKRDAGAIAALNAGPAAFAPAGAILLDRMRAEPDPEALGDLGSAVAVLRAKLPRSDVEQAGTILVKRMVSERKAEALAPMASAVDDLDEGFSRAKSAEFATALAGRMGSETNSGALLDLAVGFIAVAQQMDYARAGSIAPPLLARMQSENTAQSLRSLAFSLGTVEDGVNPSAIRTAGTRLAAVMAVETDADALRALVAGLCALKSGAGQENFEKAAAILGARIGLESDPAVLHNLSASLHALANDGGAIAENAFEAPASALVNRMIDARNPAEVRALAYSLGKIATDLNPAGSAQLASKLVARAEAEHSGDLLRAYGEVLESLPEGSLNRAQLTKLGQLLAIPNSPCGVATRVTAGGDPAHLVPAILNPLCSEESWTKVVTAFDDVAKQGIVQGEAPKIEDASDADFKSLIVPDDDDEASPASAAAADHGLQIDFNKLSQALEAYRPKEALQPERLAAEAGSGVLLLAGLVLLLVAWKSRLPTRLDRESS